MVFKGQNNIFILSTALCLVSVFIYYHAVWRTPYRTAALHWLHEPSVLPYWIIFWKAAELRSFQAAFAILPCFHTLIHSKMPWIYSIKFDFVMCKHACCYNLETFLHVPCKVPCGCCNWQVPPFKNRIKNAFAKQTHK